jgi:hypothetical protein
MNKMLQLRYYIPHAVWDVFSKVFSPLAWGRLCHKPGASLRIPEDFFGINVASSEDARCDEYVIARLQELGIKNVRLAFSYCGFDSHAARFLEKLLDHHFVVALVVLPPRDAARKMLADSEAQEEWRRFLVEVFTRYAQRVEIFEIGCTPNRKKWSGFTPRSYLQAWAIACDAAEFHSVSLVGPNIQDFEPYHNTYLLFAMGRISRVPDIHTNNLFVERVAEPESYDHRVLGKWATNLLKLNLIKKARFLQYLGDKAGCKRTISTCNFWTTKRLSRRFLNPEDKKVDYLARYLVLAASSGALSRVYWGPLICGRDGLIDDCSAGYPEIDHSSFYKTVRGNVDDFILTPAFFALGYVSRRLRNAYCDNATHELAGLSHFAFTGSENEVFHVCWCRDGQVVELNDVFSDEQLSAAVFTDACGKIVSSPAVINERPLFIDFPRRTRQ